MAVVVRGFDEEMTEFLRYDLLAFVHGLCYEFAVGVHRGTGYQMVALMLHDVPHHVAVALPSGKFLDGRGEHDDVYSLAREFEETGPDYDLVEVTEERLRVHRPICERSVARVRLRAQAAWPELPWRPDQKLERIKRFTAELEKLCRMYGFWICEPYPTTRPIVYDSDGSEYGFSIEPLVTGDYMLGRMFRADET